MSLKLEDLREKLKTVKEELKENDEILFKRRNEKGDVDVSVLVKKPHSTYVDMWLENLEQRIETLEKMIVEITNKLGVTL